MKGAILAGGKGERLRPFTLNIPKPMIKIFGKPLLEHHIRLFKSYNIRKILLCLHYLPEKIMEHFGNGEKFGVEIEYSVEKEPMGTAGALKASEGFLDETFVVMYGDNFTDINLNELEAFHKRKKSIATVALVRKKAEEKSSSFVVIDDTSRIASFVERPSQDDLSSISANFKHVNAGIYVMEPEILKFIPKSKFDFAYDLFPLLLKNKSRLFGYEIPEGTFLKEIGTIQKLDAIRHGVKNAQ